MAKRATAQEEINGLRATLAAYGALVQQERARADRAEAELDALLSQPTGGTSD